MLRILLIDDDPNIVAGLENIIQEKFSTLFEISKAYDGLQALEQLKAQYFHLIISDIKMPELDGIQLLEMINRDDVPSKVIMLSGFDDYTYMRSALKLGAYDYLLKPVNINSLTEMLTNIQGKLCESDATINSFNIDRISREEESSDYFDIPAEEEKALSKEELAAALDQLQIAVLELDEEKTQSLVRYMFQHMSSEMISKEELRLALSNFTYGLMQKNSSLIKVIALYKLSENDLAAHIKNQPHLSQLREKFDQILLLYIQELQVLQKRNEGYVVKKAQAYIEQHYGESLKLTDIAAQFKLHPNYFSALFKKQLNMTVRDYILKVRMDKAKGLMRNPDLKLLDIALAVGYQDAAHFHRAFKNITGLSPSHYRSRMER